eukprot:s1772_g14.t1
MKTLTKCIDLLAELLNTPVVASKHISTSRINPSVMNSRTSVTSMTNREAHQGERNGTGPEVIDLIDASANLQATNFAKLDEPQEEVPLDPDPNNVVSMHV